MRMDRPGWPLPSSIAPSKLGNNRSVPFCQPVVIMPYVAVLWGRIQGVSARCSGHQIYTAVTGVNLT
jgi:hypothetical protein